MYIGCGQCEMILPEDFFPSEGFVSQAHPLYARALTIGFRQPFVLVSVEMTSLPDDEITKLRALTAASAVTKPEKVWISVTHTFSAPHILPRELVQTEEETDRRRQLQTVLRDAVHTSVLKARASAEDMEIILRTGESGVPSCRDIELPDGWWVGCRGSGPANRAMTLLQFGAETPRAFLLHMNVQPSVLDGTGAENGKTVSGDLAGIACAALEKRYPGSTAFFLIGAAGDQAPCRKAKGFVPAEEKSAYREIDLHEQGVRLAEQLGNRIFEETCALLETPGTVLSGDISLTEGSVSVPAKRMNRNLRELKPSRQCEWIAEGESVQPVSLLTLGSLAILGVRPELTFPTDQAIRAASPFPHTLTATLINGGAKYMADRGAYGRCTYEAQNSPFAPGAAETLADAAIAMLKRAERTSYEEEQQ